MALDKSLRFLENLSIWMDNEAAGIPDTAASNSYLAMSRELLRHRKTISEVLEGITAKRGSAIQLTPDDLEDLPEELKEELSLSDSEQFELDILRLVEDAGGTISLDVLLVNWYRSKNKVIKRKNMLARVSRMLGKERLFSTPGYKGVYQLSRPPEVEKPESAADFYDLRDDVNKLDPGADDVPMPK